MPNYAEYLQIERLLQLQSPGDEHDEMLFIIIHQVYELWFRQILHELDFLIQKLGLDQLPHAEHAINRVLKIFKVMVAQVDILETMTPLEFLSFRARLESGSGFQSAQFRELEFLLGMKRMSILSAIAEFGNERDRLQKRMREPSLWDEFVAFVSRRGYAVPAALLQRDVTKLPEASPEFQKTLVVIYRHDPPLAEFCERLVDLDEGLQEWRYRHVKMVERTIGFKPGTGGSSGAEYLRTTLLRPIFPDLWAIRSEF